MSDALPDSFGANKLARARARIASDLAASEIPDLEIPFPYVVIPPPIDYFKRFIGPSRPAESDLPPMGW
jgi:hypothetical protein